MDPVTFFVTLIIGIIGVILIASARAGKPGVFELGYQASRQLGILLMGLVLMIFIAQIDYRLYTRIAWPTYFLFIAFLIAVLIIGVKIGGSRRWLSILGFQFQPSEFMKIFALLAICSFLDRYLHKLGETVSLVTVIITIIVPTLFIILEPDLGTSLVFIPILLGVLLMGDVSPGGLIRVVLVGIAMLPIGWLFLKDYQRDRVLSFLNQDHDVLGQGYQPFQARIAIGSGQVLGEGFFAGSQNMLDLIPGQHTDFVFTILAEEKGFIGCVILLALFATLFIRAIQIGYRCNDPLGRMIVGGVIGWLFFQVFINIGMSVGIMPVTGLPLPFMSYGGSSLISSLIGIGLIISVHNYSPKYGRLI